MYHRKLEIKKDFQERNNLFGDGQLNHEAFQLMNKPVCEENENNFRVIPK